MSKPTIIIISTILLIVLLFALSLLVGAVQIPVDVVCKILFTSTADLDADPTIRQSWIYIVLQSRLPSALTAMLSGASLAVCGLMLQTAFRNPLAGPSVFGINSGASLGVATVMLL
ncbi:MAG: iron chelate uptake ABC transporter family permease subunit, partial [Bacteroidaceae bacterium]|nr:iron chelate uptake ABC transporter family permease subunit [Bacteroidaceae bacterium]